MIHDPGVYFGMPEAEYHADESLSFHGCKDLRVGPLNYWRQSNMNPEREPDEPTPAMELGTAFHKRILEGRSAFEHVYAPRLELRDYPQALDGMTALREHGHTLGVKGASIDVLCERIAEKDPDAQLWPVMTMKYALQHHNKTLLSGDIWRQIERTSEMVAAHPDAGRAFIDGYPEVSIFWRDDETDVPKKARLDYLQLGAAVDLKTFTNLRNREINKAVAEVVASNCGQAVLYSEAVETAKHGIKNGTMPIRGEPEPSWVESFCAAPPHTFVFVLVESCAWPSIRVRTMPRIGDDGAETIFWQTGRKMIKRGIDAYAACKTVYGSKPWLDEQRMTALQDSDAPFWMTGE